MKDTLFYQQRWQRPKYIEGKQRLFELVDSYIGHAPRHILDIGCGFAKTSELFQKKYDCELYLLEGEQTTSTGDRVGKYGKVEDFRYYLPVDLLRQAWDQQNMRYTFVDGNAPSVPPGTKFDLVYSWLSCGFHYPLHTYKKFIQDHTDEHSIIIMDIRAKSHQVLDDPEYDVVKIIATDNKKRTAHLRFK